MQLALVLPSRKSMILTALVVHASFLIGTVATTASPLGVRAASTSAVSDAEPAARAITQQADGQCHGFDMAIQDGSSVLDDIGPSDLRQLRDLWTDRVALSHTADPAVSGATADEALDIAIADWETLSYAHWREVDRGVEVDGAYAKIHRVDDRGRVTHEFRLFVAFRGSDGAWYAPKVDAAPCLYRNVLRYMPLDALGLRVRELALASSNPMKSYSTMAVSGDRLPWTNEKSAQLAPATPQSAQLNESILIADSLFVRDPAFGVDDVQALLTNSGSPLAEYREMVEGESRSGAEVIARASFESDVSSILIATVLEIERQMTETVDILHSSGVPATSESDQATSRVAEIARALGNAYFQSADANLAGDVLTSPFLTRRSPSQNAATWAVVNVMLNEKTQFSPDVLTSEAQFREIFTATFNDVAGMLPFDPRAHSLADVFAHDQTLCPPDEFELPYEINEGWVLQQGPHNYGTGLSGVLSSLDFTPSDKITVNPSTGAISPQGCANGASNLKARASRAGTIVTPTLASEIIIDHGDGWQTRYLHLIDTTHVMTPGLFVGVGDPLGRPACVGLHGGVPHLHFALYYNNQPQPISENWILSGWRVYYDGATPSGYGKGSLRCDNDLRINRLYEDVYGAKYFLFCDETPIDGCGETGGGAIPDVSTILTLEKSGPELLVAGTEMSYRIRVTNTSDISATEVIVQDFAPEAANFVDSSPYSCGPIQGGGLYCGIGTLEPGDSKELILVFEIPSDTIATSGPGGVTNTAVVLSNGVVQDEDQVVSLLSDSSDLTVTKVGKPDDEVSAGKQLVYTIFVDSFGPSDARGVIVTDTILSSGNFTLVTHPPVPSQGTCSVTAGVITCDLGIIPARGRATIPIVVTADEAQDINNVVKVTSDTEDPDPDNNIALTMHSVTGVADLGIVKSAVTLGPYLAGTDVTYRLRVSNSGPSTAENAVVEDVLDETLTVVSITPSTGSCTAGTPGVPTDPLTCNFGSLDLGESASVDVTVHISSDFATETLTGTAWLENSARTYSDTFDANNANDVDAVLLDVQGRVADLRITKFGKPDGEVHAGENLTYTVVVDNLGPSTALAVVITDLLQSSGVFELLSVSSSLPASCSPTSGTFNESSTITCHLTNPLDPLTEDTSGRWTLTVVVSGDQTQDINNLAIVASDNHDSNLGNNLAYVEHAITDVADLSVTKTATGEVQVAGQAGLVYDTTAPAPPFPQAPNYSTSASEVTAGRRILYSLRVSNSGPSDAENTVLTDRLPLGVTIVPGTLTASQGSCSTGTPGSAADQFTCGLGLIGTGGSATVSFQVLVASAAVPGSVLENDAFVFSDIYEPNNANNYAHTQTAVDSWADMSVAKSAVGEVAASCDPALGGYNYDFALGQVTPGRTLRYEITVQNNGASDATNVTVLDVLPPEDAVRFLLADGASCRPVDLQGNTTLFCSLGDMPAGARKSFDVYVKVDSQATAALTNRATVLYGPASPPSQPPALPAIEPELPLTNDPLTSNNLATANTTVVPIADIFIMKQDVPAEAALDADFEPDQAVAGEEHRYRITFGNRGPSVARGVDVTDLLDFMAPGEAGEMFVRCESEDPDDSVVCSYNAATNTVQVTSFLDDSAAIIPSAGNGTLSVGSRYSFYLITEVASGYVLDASDSIATTDNSEPGFIARNTARISATTTDRCAEDNSDTERTEIVALADVTVAVSDTEDPELGLPPIPLWHGKPDPVDLETDFGGMQLGPKTIGVNMSVMQDTGFLSCDPVSPGGTVTYRVVVENLGPSDAAQVFAAFQLDATNLVVDPDLVNVSVSNGEVVLVRDDGYIEVIVGNDPNAFGVAQLGRLNAGSSETITIEVLVTDTAECGAEILLSSAVETRRNDTIWPPVGGEPRTPTPDPNLANNIDSEMTTIACPEVTVNKTISFDGTCPGQDIIVRNLVGQPVTFCFEITNTGTTFLDTIRLTDTLTTRITNPTIVFSDTFTSGADPNVPLAPGEVVTRSITVPHLLANWECGRATDTVEVTANPVNSGRTDLPCLSDVAATDTLAVDIPCAGLDWRLQLPVIDHDMCDTWIQVQNLGSVDTKAMLVLWGQAGFCPPQAAGPLKIECSGLLRPGSAWSFASSQIPVGAESGVVYALNGVDIVRNERGNRVPYADLVCDVAFRQLVGSHIDWVQFDLAYRLRDSYRGPLGPNGEAVVLDFGSHQGEPLAVSVNRACPDAGDPNVTSHAAYTGISSDMEGARDPVSGAWTFYAPMVFAAKGDLSSILHIQNSGLECTSLEIWLKAQDECLRPILGDVLALAPGETVHYDVSAVTGAGWLGSAWIRATQPMGIIVDTKGPNHLTAYTGLPGNVHALDFSYGDQVNYAPLIYSEYQGWDTALQVQNLSGTVAAKVKVYFLDRSGDIITTLVDWICPRGSQTYFLPVIAALPGNWVGSARAESQEWLSPGNPLIDPPRISTVVLLEKWADPARTSRREAIAYNAQSECLLYDWQIAPGGLGGTKSGSAVFAIPLVAKGYNGITSEIGITNLVPKPGFTDFAIYLYDQNGLLDHYCQKLGHMQVEYIDMASWGVVPQRFLGSMIVSAVFWEHEVWDGSGVFQRNLVGLGAVAVERIGGTQGGPDVPGDESQGFEAIPIFDHWGGELPPDCPGIRR